MISNLKEVKGSPTWLSTQSLKWCSVTITTLHSSFHTRWSKPSLQHRCPPPYNISWPSNLLVPRGDWRWMNWLLRYTLPPWSAAVPQLPEYLAALLFPLKSLSVAIWAHCYPSSRTLILTSFVWWQPLFWISCVFLTVEASISISWWAFWPSLFSST